MKEDELLREKLKLEVNELTWKSKYGLHIEIANLVILPIVAVIALFVVQYPKVAIDQQNSEIREKVERQKLIFEIMDEKDIVVQTRKIAAYEAIFQKIPDELKRHLTYSELFEGEFGALLSNSIQFPAEVLAKCTHKILIPLRERYIASVSLIAELQGSLAAEISGDRPGYGPSARHLDRNLSAATTEYHDVVMRLKECFPSTE